MLLYRELTPSVRLCGHCQLEELARDGRVIYRAVQENRLVNADFAWPDIVLLGRLDNWYELQLARGFRRAGKYLVYILDDDLLNMPGGLDCSEYYGQADIQRSIREILALSDAVLSPSPRLLDKYAGNGKRAIRVEEPAIDPVPYCTHADRTVVKIGFAGSLDRTSDVEQLLRGALTRIHREYGSRVAFEFFGAIPDFAGQLGARCVPYTNAYDDYRRTLNGLQWDIGLAPMPQTPFYACKHYNKFCEYAAAGVAGIYSNCEPYTRIPGRDYFGWFCANTEDDWYAAIRGAIENAELREARREMCCRAAAGELSVRAAARKLENELRAIPLPEGGEAVALNLGLLRQRLALRKLWNRLRQYGLCAPLKVIQTHLRKGRQIRKEV